MLGELIQLTFDKIMQTQSYTVIIFSGRQKRFAIYTDPSTGYILQQFLTNTKPLRPLTHTLMHSIFATLGIKVKQVVINDVQDTIYYARLFLEQEKDGVRNVIEIDARPSDCVALALMNNAPVYCTAEVLQNTVAVED